MTTETSPYKKAVEARMHDLIERGVGEQSMEMWSASAAIALRNLVFKEDPNRGEGEQALLEALIVTCPVGVMLNALVLGAKAEAYDKQMGAGE